MAEATIDDVVNLVTDEQTVVDGVVVLIAQLRDQVINAAGTLTPAQKAAIQSVFDKATAQKQKLADALVVNTPSA